MIIGNFKPETLAFKLYNSKIKNHSEQLNKYVAGLIDSDGSISLKKTRGIVYLKTTITSIDSDLLVSLRLHYNLGTTYLKDNGSICVWELADKHSKILLGRLTKHLNIKGQLSEFAMWATKDKPHVNQCQWDELKTCYTKLRETTKWLKHPKHPSWAWLAGFLDGDGYYRFYQRKRYHRGEDRYYFNNTLEVGCLQHISKIWLLEFLQTHLKGRIHIRLKDGHPAWNRALGVSNKSFALKFLKKIRLYSCIPRKYTKIDGMIKFHEK